MVKVTNSAGAVSVPLSGTKEVGSLYGGTQSGWTSVPTGTSSYTALVGWPALPTLPPIPTPPLAEQPSSSGLPTSTPTTSPTSSITPHPTITTTTPTVAVKAPNKTVPARAKVSVIQVAPKTVHVKKGKVIVSLKCVGAKGQICSGKLTFKMSGQSVKAAYRIKAGKVAKVAVTLPRKALTAMSAKHSQTLQATLAMATKEPGGSTRTTHGTLTIKS